MYFESALERHECLHGRNDAHRAHPKGSRLRRSDNGHARETEAKRTRAPTARVLWAGPLRFGLGRSLLPKAVSWFPLAVGAEFTVWGISHLFLLRAMPAAASPFGARLAALRSAWTLWMRGDTYMSLPPAPITTACHPRPQVPHEAARRLWDSVIGGEDQFAYGRLQIRRDACSEVFVRNLAQNQSPTAAHNFSRLALGLGKTLINLAIISSRATPCRVVERT
jgi:hypothetical protein